MPPPPPPPCRRGAPTCDEGDLLSTRDPLLLPYSDRGGTPVRACMRAWTAAGASGTAAQRSVHLENCRTCPAFQFHYLLKILDTLLSTWHADDADGQQQPLPTASPLPAGRPPFQHRPPHGTLLPEGSLPRQLAPPATGFLPQFASFSHRPAPPSTHNFGAMAYPPFSLAATSAPAPHAGGYLTAVSGRPGSSAAMFGGGGMPAGGGGSGGGVVRSTAEYSLLNSAEKEQAQVSKQTPLVPATVATPWFQPVRQVQAGCVCLLWRWQRPAHP